MKKLLTLLCAVLFGINLFAATVTVGSGSTYSNTMPVRVSSKYAINQYIIQKTQMVDDATSSKAESGNITEIQFRFRNYMDTYPAETEGVTLLLALVVAVINPSEPTVIVGLAVIAVAGVVALPFATDLLAFSG